MSGFEHTLQVIVLALFLVSIALTVWEIRRGDHEDDHDDYGCQFGGPGGS